MGTSMKKLRKGANKGTGGTKCEKNIKSATTHCEIRTVDVMSFVHNHIFIIIFVMRAARGQ